MVIRLLLCIPYFIYPIITWTYLENNGESSLLKAYCKTYNI